MVASPFAEGFRHVTWRRLCLLAAAMIGLLHMGAAHAQADPPPSIAEVIRAKGHTVDGPAMAALFGPLQERAPYKGVRVIRDVGYGPADRHQLDIFVPDGPPIAHRPVLVFVHGGGFVGGARRLGPDSPFYDNVALWAARHGFVGINATYRLAPAAPWPAGAEDVARVVHWVHAQAASYGGDPGRVFLMGHSAGATHVASYVGGRQFWGGPTPLLKGAIIVSGSFTVEALQNADPADRPLLARAAQYFGEAPQRFAEESSLAGLVAAPVPLLIANAELDPPYFLHQRALLETALRPRGRHDIDFALLSGHNHMSEIDSVNAGDTVLTRDILDFVRRH